MAGAGEYPAAVEYRQHRRSVHRTSVRYGDLPSQLLDVWRRKDLPAEPAPVLIFVPGGAWVHGSRLLQGYALMSHLAEMGWVCLSIDYRVAPHHRWPAHITDVKTAIAWARANVDKFGGDRNFVAVAGCSAGGHLSALAGLTRTTRRCSANCRTARTPPSTRWLASTAATTGRTGRRRSGRACRLPRTGGGRAQDLKHPDVFRKASPIAQVHEDAPPFLVIHGTGDSVIPVEQARSFVERLRAASHSVVSYVELPGAGHAFDMIDGARTGSMVTAIGLFLNQIHRNRTLTGPKRLYRLLHIGGCQ